MNIWLIIIHKNVIFKIILCLNLKKFIGYLHGGLSKMPP